MDQYAEKVQYMPIGSIHSPFKDLEGMPIQPTGGRHIRGTVEIYPEYTDGLKDLDEFSHIILIYHLHLSDSYDLEVIPFMDDVPHGLFSTRAPKRPNPIGISIVKLIKIEGNIIHIENMDMIDETPLLDIKPYVPEFDPDEIESIGWLSKSISKVRNERADDRFK